jgi:TolB-like protein
VKNIFGITLSLVILFILSACATTLQYDDTTSESELNLNQKVQVSVYGKAKQWKNSGVIVQKGSKYHVSAKGKWSVGTYCGWQGPDGGGIQWGPLCWDIGGMPLVGWSAATLTAKIGDHGDIFAIGEDLTFTAQEDGTLYFRMNDNEDWFHDNDGAVSVTTSRIDTGSGGTEDESSLPKQPSRSSTTSGAHYRTKILKTAVVEFTEQGNLDVPDAGRIVADWMTSALNKSGAFEIYERLSLDKLIDEYNLQMSGITDVEKIAEIGKIHGVEAIVTGSISKFADTISVTVKLIDTKTSKIIDTADIKTNSIDAIPSEIDKLATALATD